MENCPVCECKLIKFVERPNGLDGNRFNCPNCGYYEISRTAQIMLGNSDKYQLAVLSHAIWKHQREDGPLFVVSTGHVEAVENEKLPRPAEMLDLLILFIGDYQNGIPGTSFEGKYNILRAKIGAENDSDVNTLLKFAQERSLITGHGPGKSNVYVKLSFQGWQYYEDLKRGKTSSRTAFMAMPFGNQDVCEMVDHIFRDAVKKTGFTLKRLDDQTPAGLIDNRMRVEIRNCRFLIADLTGGNNGAYWEAGFAEGLGKQVIFTCEKEYYEKNKTHFDTNHHHTILWSLDDPEKAAEDLKSTIRATLPFEAQMED